jgi:valyl-tRNA synthetase
LDEILASSCFRRQRNTVPSTTAGFIDHYETVDGPLPDMTEPIASRFDFKAAQPRIFRMWEEGGFFHARPRKDRKPFTIVIPPPNVTGALHLGHALNNTLQDVLIRMKRMQGFETLWMPGTDHAGIATQARVEARLREEESLTRHDLGRDKLVERIWQWKDEYEARIISQLKQMGCSCDWERTRFTLDEMCATAVRHTFFDLFRSDRIYRGKRLVNWDTFLQTAVSDDEVNNETVQGHFWHIRYPVASPGPGEPAHVVVATTRPETMLGDTAVAVHPHPDKALASVEQELRDKLASCSDTERVGIEASLKGLEQRRVETLPGLLKLAEMARTGRQLVLPLLNRFIPLIVDEWAKPELGSGCVKITPAHDPNDHEVGKRHGLPMPNILNPDGTLNNLAGAYAGLTIKAARKKIVDDLDAAGLLEKVEQREIELPVSDRSKTPIEPMLADQWFVRMAELSQSAIDAVRDGRVRITPARYSKSYLDWLGEKRDWPVSRQLWWGHRIPVWSRTVHSESELEEVRRELEEGLNINGTSAAIQIESAGGVSEASDKNQPLLAIVHVCILREKDPLEEILERFRFRRVDDVLDTWFSSALWPMSTLGWPGKTEEFDYFYPTDVLITSRDIITLWVARMVLMGLNNVGEVPFRQVYIHPKILDGEGETMSKSRGNGIDPLDVIDKFGSDALRCAMAELCTDTQDIRVPVQFECPHCESGIEQTRKNRTLPRIECPKCKKAFSTQWARTAEDIALPRGPVLSERFEVARNFTNKLWNAFRFSTMNLEDYSAGEVDPGTLPLEDRWILGRLESVIRDVSACLEEYRFSEAAGKLRDFTWNDFCSNYIELLKDRFSDSSRRPAAQRMLVHCFDQLLRLLHPIMPFISEEIWQRLGEIAPVRGFPVPRQADGCLIRASWPEESADFLDAETENRFTLFQRALTAVRDIRSQQNIAPKKAIQFVVRTSESDASALRPLIDFFPSMANAQCREIGPEAAEPRISAPLIVGSLEIFVDLDGLIDLAAERKRREKEVERCEKLVQSRRNKLANENFVRNAPPDILERERAGLSEAENQLKAAIESARQFAELVESRSGSG